MNQETSMQMRVVQGGKTRAITSVAYPPTKEDLDKAFARMDEQMAESEPDLQTVVSAGRKRGTGVELDRRLLD